jgi:hypothetical protein
MSFKYFGALLMSLFICAPAVGQSCRSGVDCTGSTPYCSLTSGYCCAGSSQYACQDSYGNGFCSSSSSCSSGGSGGGGGSGSCQSGVDCTGSTPYCSLTSGYCCAGSSQYACQDSYGNGFCSSSSTCSSGGSGGGGGGSTVIEFYNTNLDNYFITADANEVAAINSGAAGVGWQSTGSTFKSGGNTPVCRFYGSLSPGPNSHFYTLAGVECDSLKQLQTSTPASQKRWNFESLDFYSTLPITSGLNGICPTGTVPVYRAYNKGSSRGIDSNHRITSSQTALQEVIARGWNNEGIVMCAPQ